MLLSDSNSLGRMLKSCFRKHSFPVEQQSCKTHWFKARFPGQTAEKVDVCSVCSSNILTSSTDEFAGEKWVVHIGVMHVPSGANSNLFLKLQLGEIPNTKKQY